MALIYMLTCSWTKLNVARLYNNNIIYSLKLLHEAKNNIRKTHRNRKQLVRKNMDVNEHERQSNITYKQIKVKERRF